MGKVLRKHKPSPAQISNPVMSARFTPLEHQYVLNALQLAGVGFRRYVLNSVALNNASFQRGFQAGRSLANGLVNPIVDIVCDMCGQVVARLNLMDPQVWRIVQTALASRFHPACYQTGRPPTVP
jgi:hypothetical protein